VSIFGGGGQRPPPKPKLADIQQVGNQAANTDITGLNLSDQNLQNQFPGMVAARNDQISNAAQQLTGPLDPTVENTFVNQGMQGAYNAFGSGDPYATITPGAATGNAVATSVANNVQNKQDYDRAYFESILQPNRQIGISGSDVGNLTAANVAAINNYRQTKYGGMYGNYNANQASSQQASLAAASAAASLAAAGISASDRRIKKNIRSTGVKTGEGIPIKTFKMKHDPTRRKRIGLIAQDVEKKRPDAVVADPHTGIKLVDYGKLIARGIR
jgi:hypothetical protein